jgi:predicted RNA binding protein YcfA (HicA-like mRNA interferase family)
MSSSRAKCLIVGCNPLLDCTKLRPHTQGFVVATRPCSPSGDCTQRAERIAANQAIHTLHTFVIDKTPYSVDSTHVDSRTVVRLLKADGWFEVNQVGSHKQFKHPTKTGRVTVMHPKKDIPIGTLRSIQTQAGLKF